MIDFETAIQLGEEVLASLDRIYHLINPAPADGSALPAATSSEPGLLQFRRRLLAAHARRHLVTELAATGKLSTSDAQSMVDSGRTTGARPAAGAAFANILAWLQSNGPTIAQDIAQAIPIIISLITLFE